MVKITKVEYQDAQLPVNCSADDKRKLGMLGVLYCDICPDNENFQNVKLPAGWFFRPNPSPKWTELCDEKGDVIADISTEVIDDKPVHSMIVIAQ